MHMRLMVIGGTRYSGRTLLELCAENSAFSEVCVVSRRAVEMKGVTSVVLDRKDENALRQAILAFAPDVLVDMICYDGADAAAMGRMDGEGSLRCVQHYVVISTFFLNQHDVSAFGISAGSDAAEIARIADGYTRRKAQMEWQLAHSSLHERSTTLRLPFIFSRDDYTDRFQTFCRLARTRPVESFGQEPRFSMIEKTDTAKAIMALASQPPRGLCAACNPGSVSARDLAKLIVEEGSVVSQTGEMAEVPYSVMKNLELACAEGVSLRSLRAAVIEEARNVR
ncbi:hypothetical protein [Fuscovulum ytuae]|uniref:NAD(P)-binding domain-containing protein n=1 Tax=Fuscovulum ytuae TaxID=3042299 RepID=A0ABY8Q3R7_9RHOB|nr:hypothetical protein [Fuscovulum sp. YMD61]WGV15288.1 hypothetical protein QF092_13545 [Fuscovulum sp. YMD61]